MDTQTYRFELFADYFQFYLLDDKGFPNVANIWTKDSFSRKLAVGEGIIVTGTARNMNVPVTIKIQHKEPMLELDKWDKVNECSLTVTSGKIVVMGATDLYNNAPRINVQPGIYRVRVHYGSLDNLSEDGLEGEDHYELILWSVSKEKPVEELK